MNYFTNGALYGTWVEDLREQLAAPLCMHDHNKSASRARGVAECSWRDMLRQRLLGNIIIYLFIDVLFYVLKAYSPVNRTGSPEGFSLNQTLHKLSTMQNILILQTYIIL